MRGKQLPCIVRVLIVITLDSHIRGVLAKEGWLTEATRCRAGEGGTGNAGLRVNSLSLLQKKSARTTAKASDIAELSEEATTEIALKRVSMLQVRASNNDTTAIVVNPPQSTMPGLFRDTRHSCDQEKRTKFLEAYPLQANKTVKQEEISRGLKLMHQVFAQHKLPTVLAGGSLLGFFRQCDVIPTDADGDLYLLSSWLSEPGFIDKLKVSLAEAGATLQTEMCPKGPGFYGCEYRAVFFVQQGWQVQFHVDIMVLGQDASCSRDPVTCTFQYCLWPGGAVSDKYAPCHVNNAHFEQAEFLGEIFWVPTPSLSYVVDQYGVDWAKPGGSVYKSCNFKDLRAPSQILYGAAENDKDMGVPVERFADGK